VDKKHEFSEGDDVRIREGTFASFVGTVVRVNDQDKRLTAVGRFETQPDSDPHTINVSFFVAEKLAARARETHPTG